MQDQKLLIERTFNAPRELVFKVWTEAEHLAKWWGPKGFNIKVKKLDLQPGGVFHYSMQTPDGKEIWGKFIYREISAPERLVFINSFSDADELTTENPWLPGWPLETLTILTLTEENGKTLLTLTGMPLNATAAQEEMYSNAIGNMQQGFKGTFEQLDQYLSTISI